MKTSAAVLVVLAVALMVGPRLLGWQLHMVLTSSMSPSFDAGAVVAVEPIRPEAVEVGNVVTFARPSGPPVTHRVVEVVEGGDGPTFVTKGDRNEDVDSEPMQASAVVGKVRADLPYLGYFAEFMRQPLGFVLLIAVPGCAFVLFEIRSMLVKHLRARPKAATPA